MHPCLLLAETEVSESGAGTAFDLGALRPDEMKITLGITATEREHSLELSILGSEDGTHWFYPPLGSFAQKFYCGTYNLLLDLRSRPDVRYVLPRWKLSRCGCSFTEPLFGLYVLAEPAEAAVSAHGAA